MSLAFAVYAAKAILSPMVLMSYAEIFENMGIGGIRNDITETAVERAPNFLSCEKRPYRPTGERLALPPVPGKKQLWQTRC